MASNSRFAGNLFVVLALFSMHVCAADLTAKTSILNNVVVAAKSSSVNPGAKTPAAKNIFSSHWKWDGRTEGLLLPAGLPQDEFELMLQQRFYGSYVFYRKLNPDDQLTVYQQYRKAVKPDLENVHQDILELLK